MANRLQSTQRLSACAVLSGLAAAWLCLAAPLVAQANQDRVPQDRVPQDRVPQDNAQEIERLRGQLSAAGADHRDARAAAVVRLLRMPQPAAHRVLQQVVEGAAGGKDVEGLAVAVLEALQQHLLELPSGQFGGAAGDVRREILTGYIGACALFWAPGGSGAATASELPQEPLGPLARRTLQRCSTREIAEAVRALVPTGGPVLRAALLRCAADLQQLALAPVLAEYLDDRDPELRGAAAQALRILTFQGDEFPSRAQFTAWFERLGDLRYVDLAERVAREAAQPRKRELEELQRVRVEAARDFVRACTARRSGIDWVEVQARTLSDDAKILDACLEQLQQALLAGLPAEDSPAARQAFCRALLQRWRSIPNDPALQGRRSLLLEVAAGLGRAEEAELAAELTSLLFAQIESGTVEEQAAALRGLRRYPTVDARTRVVRFCQQLLAQGLARRPVLEAALATLGSSKAPRWCAPSEADPDRADWLELVRSLCLIPEWAPLRDSAMQLLLTLDAREQRLGGAFGLLLELAREVRLEARFRCSCLIQMQGWREQTGQAEAWVRAMQDLLDDPEPEVRQVAAESLVRVVDSVDPRRPGWVAATIQLLRDHLAREGHPAVFRAMAEALQVCGREPAMAERAITAIHAIFGDLGEPVPAEQQFRVEPLLGTLATIASDARADRGQWLGACRLLHQFGKRQSLCLLLQNHSAIDLAREVGSSDALLAERAREAVGWVLRAALLKPPREPWTASEELLREARDVRTAFTAFDGLDEALRPDDPALRLLRLEVDLAGGKFQDVAQRATGWLSGRAVVNPAPRAQFSVEQRERARVLLAEAWLGLNRPELAARDLLEGNLDGDGRATDLLGRLGKALLASDPATALVLFERSLRATPAEDPAFRGRLLDWASVRLRPAPGGTPDPGRAAVLDELARYAVLFDAQDCPPEQRALFLELRKGG
ncbi:MAG: hypothetical protein JNK49_18520 [Planctomycetes bacterium]|nr:hypothetical protein [Planctomycetota bacterium]